MVSLNPFANRAESDDDERIAKRADNGSERADRATSDRSSTQNREVSDSVRAQERRGLLRDTNTLLPAAPEVPGFHSMWATTTNNKDTPETRMRQGYSYITRAEAPNFQFITMKASESPDDRITVSEMVAMKIPLEMWKSDVLDLHYDFPKEQLMNLKNKVKQMTDGRGKKIAYTGRTEGFEDGQTDGFQAIDKMKRPTLTGLV